MSATDDTYRLEQGFGGPDALDQFRTMMNRIEFSDVTDIKIVAESTTPFDLFAETSPAAEPETDSAAEDADADVHDDTPDTTDDRARVDTTPASAPTGHVTDALVTEDTNQDPEDEDENENENEDDLEDDEDREDPDPDPDTADETDQPPVTDTEPESDPEYFVISDHEPPIKRENVPTLRTGTIRWTVLTTLEGEDAWLTKQEVTNYAPGAPDVDQISRAVDAATNAGLLDSQRRDSPGTRSSEYRVTSKARAGLKLARQRRDEEAADQRAAERDRIADTLADTDEDEDEDDQDQPADDTDTNTGLDALMGDDSDTDTDSGIDPFTDTADADGPSVDPDELDEDVPDLDPAGITFAIVDVMADADGYLLPDEIADQAADRHGHPIDRLKRRVSTTWQAGLLDRAERDDVSHTWYKYRIAPAGIAARDRATDATDATQSATSASAD